MDFTITDQIPVRAQDNFALRFRRGAPEITYDRVALFNTSLQKTVAVGHLEESGNSPKIVFSAADIDYKSIQKNRNHEIILFPKDKTDKKFYAIECKLGFQDLEEAKRTLCIDFGTSNTTAGSYGILDEQANQPEIVKFPDVTDPNNTTRQMIPTLVYIDSCEDGKEIRYAFGYDAKKRIIDDHFESKATVFHEIKSWINDLDKEEEIFDSQGNNGKVRREDVIKAYLAHVITLSEQYFHKRFKYLHFSAPVKLKNSFLNKMQEMFPKPNYWVHGDGMSLDEGIAIVYNHIAKRIKNIQSGQSETVFVIDCGGGTTDLAKCEYSYTTANIGDGKKVLSVETSFENGDSSFGGNNITYRILQLLKIKIDAYLQHESNPEIKSNPDMLEIVSKNEIEIMSQLDDAVEIQNGNNTDEKNEDYKSVTIFSEKESLYKNFIEKYEAAEKHIPTRHKEASFNDDRQFMRRNFNYLWQMAEAIKIEFYKSSSTVAVNFSKEEDRKICIGGQDDYYLYVRKDENSPLEKKIAPLGNIEITIKEINRIICPDIYALLSTLLGEYDNKTLQEVNYYKLSGQSCNIMLFHDLMKEFVPGRNIRRNTQNSNKDGNDEDRTDELKIACLEGSICYLMDKEFGYIKPEIKMASPRMVYEIYEDGDNRSVLDKDNARLLRKFVSARRIHFIVRDIYGQQKNSVFYNFEKNGEELSLGVLKKRLRDDTYWNSDVIESRIITPLNNITLHSQKEVEQCIFLLPAKDGYGFRIYHMIVSYNESNGATIYSLVNNRSSNKTNGEYHSFEQMSSFFDGTR